MQIIKTNAMTWVLRRDGENLCIAENCSFEDAIDAFAANFPELVDRLAMFECDEFCGTNGAKPKREKVGGKKKRGSGARFRELIMGGKSNEECLRIVREEFPESTATLSDAAWNRALLRKNPAGFAADGSKI